MRSVFLACLLVVAGVSAFPRDVDVAPSDGRIVDLVILDVIQRYKDWIKKNEFDPLWIERYEFDDTIINDLVHFRGHAIELKLIGLGDIIINRLSYNLGLGRLDFDFSIGKITFSIVEYKADIRYGNSGGNGVLSGELEIENIRLRGDALLLLYPGSPVTILNINTLFSIEDIRANFAASWQCLGCREPADYSSEVNQLLNSKIPEFLATFEPEIGTIFGELIRYIVNWLHPAPN